MHQRLALDSTLHIFSNSDGTCNNCILLYTWHGIKMLLILAWSATVHLECDVVTIQAMCKPAYAHIPCQKVANIMHQPSICVTSVISNKRCHHAQEVMMEKSSYAVVRTSPMYSMMN